MAKAKCSIIVYGCSKNQLDAEEMAVRLRQAGFQVVPDPSSADIVIVHTCGFIQDAKKESIEGVLMACRMAEEGSGARVLVTGCLSQRYPDELAKEIPEISGVAGTAAPKDIVELVNAALSGERVEAVGVPGRGAPGGEGLRLQDVTGPWSYLRVSEGCRHRCTYCAIPGIRGPLASRPMEEVVAEARLLSSLGVRELNLIAEDLSDYGYDWDRGRHLPRLLAELAEIEEIMWIRLLYVRPDGVTPELAEAMAHPKIVPYIDLPIEHGSDKILRLMGRPGVQDIRRAVSLLRQNVPGLHLRTTVIAGFPGETEEDLKETIDFLREIGAHRVGVFAYSREEGTPAYLLPDVVPEELGKERAERVRRAGLALAKKHSRDMIGSTIPVLLTGPSTRKGYWVGRGPHQAPEVDGKTYVKVGDMNPAPGQIVNAKVTDAAVLDLFASV
ncbi:MAG TPA: 30S ribosomal protein S12 methylthiotransferase RimO [Firmicutes bacterium]|nr:30S ribosomal protein S12 methylthiotransferase RimO [Candidatus Fermentithermobacillaceae bacterium]